MNLLRVLVFLLDTVFFVLVGCALLRGWMNTRRLRMTQQPGLFAMAATDWLVKPLRRILPRSIAHANTDWGSLVAALLLTAFYSALWHGLVTLLSDLPVLEHPSSWITVGALFFARTVLQLLMLLVLVQALLSWVQPLSPTFGLLSRLLEPVLRPIRQVVPTVGGVDLSSLVLLVLLQVGLMLLN